MGSIKIESGPKFPPKQVESSQPTALIQAQQLVPSRHKFCAELGSVGQWRALLNTKGTKWSLADACCATAWAATTRRRRPPKMCEIRMAQNQMVVVVEEEGISSMTRRTKGGQRMLQQRHYLPKVCLARRVEVGRSGHAKVRNRRR